MMAGGGSVEAPARKARIDVWLFKPMDSRAGENVVFLGLRSEAKVRVVVVVVVVAYGHPDPRGQGLRGRICV